MELYKNIKLDKGMYGRKGKSLTEVLEEMDPSENYKNTPLEKMDAFQRQLKRFDIKVSGPKSDIVEKFFQTSDSAALFPEYVSRAVMTGVQYQDMIPTLTAATTIIDGFDYRSIVLNSTDAEKTLTATAEGAALPESNITVQANLVKLTKKGRMLVSSYEALRFQRIDVFTVMLKQIGAYIAKMQLDEAVRILVSGDGNTNSAKVITLEKAEFDYGQLLSGVLHMQPYKPNVMIANNNMIQTLCEMPQFQDSIAGQSFHATGESITPLGAKLIRSTGVPENQLLMVDSNYALEYVQAGEIITEYDKLIDRQLERATISIISGFTKLIREAAYIIKLV